MELAGLQKGGPRGVLDAVKTALKRTVEGWNDVYYDLEADSLIASKGKRSALPFHALSDGVRNMLAMVADIAHRAAVLNPHLAKEAARMSSGVVLIDELDLHLHPSWQRRVVADLRRTFRAFSSSPRRTRRSSSRRSGPASSST